MGVGNALANGRILRRAVFPGDAQHLVELVLEQHLLPQGGHPALETQQAHGHLPALPRLADDVVGAANRLVEKHLVEFAGAGELLDGAHGYAGLVHGQQEEPQPLVPHRLRVGAGDGKTVPGFVGQGGPDLLPGQAPLAAGPVEAGFGPDVGQVRTGAGLGVALAPQVLTPQYARQVARLLRLAAEGDQRGAGEGFTDMAHATGAAGAGVLLVENDLLLDTGAATAVLPGPAQAGPAALVQLAFPGLTLLDEAVLVAGTAAKADLLELAAQVSGQPVGHFPAKPLILFTETQLHATTSASRSSKARASRSRCQAPLPRKVSVDLARLKYSCMSYSAVKPTPPCSWMPQPALKK